MIDYDKAASYWIEADKLAAALDRDLVKTKIDEFLAKHKTCALATGDSRFVRCTPIEYLYFDDCFWMFSEGGLKFRALKNNKNVCLAIYDEYAGFGKLHGMQITGIADMVEPWSEEYLICVEKRGIPVEAFKRLPEPMNLIKIKPRLIDFLNSDFKADGGSSRQQYRFDGK